MDEFFKKVNQKLNLWCQGDKYIMKKVRVVPLACAAPTPTKYESDPLKNKGNIKLWKKVNFLVNQKVNLGRCPMPTQTLLF